MPRSPRLLWCHLRREGPLREGGKQATALGSQVASRNSLVPGLLTLTPQRFWAVPALQIRTCDSQSSSAVPGTAGPRETELTLRGQGSKGLEGLWGITRPTLSRCGQGRGSPERYWSDSQRPAGKKSGEDGPALPSPPQAPPQSLRPPPGLRGRDPRPPSALPRGAPPRSSAWSSSPRWPPTGVA